MGSSHVRQRAASWPSPGSFSSPPTADLDSRPRPGETPDQGIARLLVRAGRDLLDSPLLAHAMMQSNNASIAQSPAAGVTETFAELMLAAGGIEEPTPYDLRLLRLLEQAWYGVVITALNRRDDPDELAADTELMCRLLLGGREDAGSDRDRAHTACHTPETFPTSGEIFPG